MSNVFTPNHRTKGFQHFPRGIEDKIGYQGEKIFNDFLTDCEIETNWEFNKYPDYDFLINGYTIDVKTVEEPFKTRFLLPIFEKIKCNFYVSVKLPETINGYITRLNVLKLDVQDFGHCYARWKYLDQLKNIKELIKILQKINNE